MKHKPCIHELTNVHSKGQTIWVKCHGTNYLDAPADFNNNCTITNYHPMNFQLRIAETVHAIAEENRKFTPPPPIKSAAGDAIEAEIVAKKSKSYRFLYEA